MHSQLIMPLADVRQADVRQADVAQVGGKAATLGMLRHAGFPVPEGLCIMIAAFDLALADRQPEIQRLLRQGDLSMPYVAQSTAQAIAELLEDLSLPAELEDALAASLFPWTADSTPLAVRSSSLSEDGRISSYAGQYTTTLGVRGLDEVKQAILVGWRSFFSANALVARAAHDALDAQEGMALLIQPMLTADCAGVAFSIDPVQQRRDLLVLNAAWGIGVGVVDGTVATDTAWIKRADLQVERQQIVAKSGKVGLDNSGILTQLPVPLEQQRAACLPSTWLERLAQLTLAAESYLDIAVEVEWAVANRQLWLLQARPITGLPADLTGVSQFPVAWQNDEERHSLWRLEQGEGQPEVLPPLELDNALKIAETHEEGCRLLGVERNQQLKICKGRIYMRPIPMPWTEADCRIRRAAWLDLRLRLQEEGLTAWDYWGPEIVTATERLRTFDRALADGPALAEHLEDVLAVRRRHMPLHPAMEFRPPQSYYDAFSSLSGLTGEESVAVANRLLDSEETPLTQLIDALYSLALLARQEPALVALITDPPLEIITHLQAMPQALHFLGALQELLRHYGERTGDGWGSTASLQTPTWEERPDIVLSLVAHYLDPRVEAPMQMRQRACQMREAEVASCCASSSDPTVVAEFRRQLSYACKVAAVVEQHNQYMDQMYTGQLRQALVAAATWLVKQGRLRQQEELFWFSFVEINKLLRGSNEIDPVATIAARQSDYQQWRTLTAPPILGIPDADLPERSAWGDEVTHGADNDTPAKQRSLGNRLTGLGASHGCHSGIARVANDRYRLPTLSPGDILVAENIGPLWTPLFPILGGLVLERGSVGQHAAATAREYGVPVAIQVKDACQRIVDGNWISVDGKTGVVELYVLGNQPLSAQ